MRYAKYITAISLMLFAANTFACGPIIYSPSEYYLFHLVNLPDGPGEGWNPNSRENCLLWQRQTSEEIPLEDIYQVVYKYDLELLTAMRSGILPIEAKDNRMARWLVAHNAKSALDYLVLAKNCEWLRSESLSPWYYPSKNDPVKYTLNEVAEVAQKKTIYYYGDRYALQAVRAMTSLKQYEEIIRFWNDMEGRISEGLMRRMILPYVAGAYVHLDSIEVARNYYKQANDISGLLECDPRYASAMNRVEQMALLYENYPDCPGFRRELWEILGHIEPNRKWEDEWCWGWRDDREELNQLADLCDKVINGNLPADKALWAYAATYIAHLKGDDLKADRYLKTAESIVRDQDLSDAIKVMRIYIDAQISRYDKAYEQKLFAQLRWLQQKIESDLDKEVIKDFHLYQLNNCFSHYYWNDAMRCILLGTVCPKMVEQGNTTLALQLANMASYSLLNEINKVELEFWWLEDIAKYGKHLTLNLYQYRHSNFENSYDYRCHFIDMADTLTANDLMAYTEVALRPQTDFQRFLNAHSYVDSDYLNEMIGTHCLREMRYADAERYLAKVSPDYFIRTNVYKEGYLNRDPFSVNPRKWNHGTDAKLFFARKMNQLEQDIAATTDPNLKAMLMIDFGIDIRNSFDYCWALTHYVRGWAGGVICSDWEYGALTQQAMQRADRMFSKALNDFIDDEHAAQAQLLFCNYQTVCERYPETLAAAIVRGHCDQYIDYHAER
jgi:hypothetical protein